MGSSLCRMLRKDGIKFTVISRNPENNNHMSWEDLQNKGLPECDAVVNLVGENIGKPNNLWTSRFKQKVIDSRLGPTKMLTKAIAEAKVKPSCWVSASAIGYYKADPNVEHTEDSPGGDFDFFSKLCTDWEAAAQLPPELGVRHVTTRIGLVLGRGGGIVMSLYVPFMLGLGATLGSGKQAFPWIHVDDASNFIKYAIEQDHVAGVVNLVAPQKDTNADFTRAFAAALSRPAFLTVPEFAIKLMFGGERADAMINCPQVVAKRTLELGYNYMYPDLKSAAEEFKSPMPLKDMDEKIQQARD